MKMRKNLFGGFKKKDVVNYISEENARYESQIEELKRENALLEEKNESLSQEKEAIKSEFDLLEKELKEKITQLENTIVANMAEYNKERLCANSHITELQLKRKQLLKELDENLLAAELRSAIAERDALQVKLQRAIIERDYARKGE